MSLLLFLLSGCSLSEPPEPLVIPIESATGIGTETISRPETGWPEEVILQLKVQNLESFGISYGVQAWQLDGATGAEPTWSRQVNAKTKTSPAAIRWERGFWFYITLPDELMSMSPPELQVSWINEHRR